MSDDELKFQQEEDRIKRYEISIGKQATESNTDLAYRDMNSRYINLEQKGTLSLFREDALQEHLQHKEEIERQWHMKTSVRAGGLLDRGATKDKKSPKFYANFNMKEMEVLLKNSDRGGNSTEYNDVATDLELFNSMEEKLTDDAEKIDLLQRLQESCNTYISKKHPFSTKGKIRKAMIRRIAEQVKEKLQSLGADATIEKDKTATATKSQAGADPMGQVNATFAAMQSTRTEDAINAAVKAHYELLTKAMAGEIELSSTQKAQLDSQMATVLTYVKTLPIDSDQNDVTSTRFFNALGWTSRKPKVVDQDEMEEEVQASPLQKRMYTSIQHYGTGGDAVPLARQLLGQEGKRQYMSDGLAGKGTYLAVDIGVQGYGEKQTSDHCWNSYGKTEGSVQLTVCFNDRARIVTENDLDRLVRDNLETQFPQVYAAIQSSEETGARRHGKFIVGKQNLSLFAALFGFNVIKANAGSNAIGGRVADYYVVIDRSAMTISDTIEIRQEAGFDFERTSKTLR